MNWKLKAKVQNVIVLFPPAISHAIYYWLQRRLGALRHVNPLEQLSAGVDACTRIERFGRSPENGVFLEVGTGRRIGTPLAYWLLGAKRVVSVDLNPYLKEELIREDLAYIRDNRAQIEQLFGNRMRAGRLESLLQLMDTPWRLDDLLNHTAIEYLAPADAADLPLSSGSIDYHTSYTVLEHIAKADIVRILSEGNRVVRPDGLFVHRVDYSDHFSHSDSSISPINFLQYSDEEWAKIADNRYMFMNRLREDDILRLFDESHHSILACDSLVDEAVAALLQSNAISVDERFADKTHELLATTGSWIVSRRPQ